MVGINQWGKGVRLEKAEKLVNQGLDLYQQNRFNEAIEKWKAAKPVYEGLEMPHKVADVEVNIGAALYALGRSAEALGHYEAAKPIYEGIEMAQRVAHVEMNIGNALYALGRPAEALGHYEAAKLVYESLKLEADVADAEVNIGNALYGQGRSAEALGHYEAAKPIYEGLEMAQRVAHVEVNIGNALYALGRPAEALGHYEAAKLVYKGLEMAHKAADAEVNIGTVLHALGRFAEALGHYEAAKLVYESLKLEADVADVEVNIGNALYALGRRAEALGHHKAAKPVFERLEMPNKVADAEVNIGNALYGQGHSAEALGHYEAAKLVYESLKLEADVADVEVNIGAALDALGRSAEALGHYMAAKPVFERFDMPQQVALVEMNIGKILRALGRSAEALGHFEAAKPVFERLDMPHKVADLEMDIGAALRALSRPAEAIRHYEAAKLVYERLEMPNKVADAEVTIGNALHDLRMPAEALGHYEAAKPIYEGLEMEADVANTEANIGVALCALGRSAEAIKKFEIALSVYEDLGFLRQRGVAYRNMAVASMVLGDFESALHDLNRSFELMERVRTGVRSPELQRSLKEQYLDVSDALCAVHLELWKREGGLEHLDEALNSVELAKCSSVAESLEAGGGGVPCPEMQKLIMEEGRFLNIAKQKYHEMLELRKLRMDGQTTRAEFRGSSADLEKEYDAIYERIERLRSEILVKCADVGSTPIPRTYNVLRRALEVFPREERWNILEFAISSLKKKLIVFLVDQDGSIQCVVHDVDLGEVKNLVLRCQGIVEKVRARKRKEANEELGALSKQLYAALIPEEIGKALKSRDVEHLILIPHKFLHWVPFDALFDGYGYWGLKYAISTDFSLDLARLSVEKPEKRATKLEESLSFLLVKNPLLDLPGADKEADSVLNILEAQGIQYKVLEHEKATQPAFIEAANERPFSVLHHAGHAFFMGKDPSLSHLHLHTDGECARCSGRAKLHTSKLLTATEMIHRVKFKGTPIVYLSTCESGVAEVEPGDEMFGLVRGLMYAGATSLVLSRWLVRDLVAPVFAAEFYRQLLGRESVAVALRNARKKVFNDEPLNFTDWAVFSLQGDPFRRLA